jgi:hypothetical protein
VCVCVKFKMNSNRILQDTTTTTTSVAITTTTTPLPPMVPISGKYKQIFIQIYITYTSTVHHIQLTCNQICVQPSTANMNTSKYIVVGDSHAKPFGVLKELIFLKHDIKQQQLFSRPTV